MRRERIVLIGVGDEYRHDDGVAVAVLAELATDEPAVDRITLCDGEPTRLMELWEDADLAVVVDSVHGDPQRPGRIRHVTVRPDHGTDPLEETSAAGTHGLGLGNAVALASALGRLPGELEIIAVEGADYSPGEGLSQPVAEAAHRAAALVREVVTARRARVDGRG